MTSTIGVPIKLLNEATGHTITLEIATGQIYRGKLLEAEDNMNVQLKDITVTARDGRVSHLDQVYIRGSHVRYFIVPDMLRNAPMFRSRDLTGSAPENREESNAGLSHVWLLETQYYKVGLPIWIDEIRNVSEWRNEFMSNDAKEVVQALGAWIYCFRKPVSQTDMDTIKDTLRALSEVRDGGAGYTWDGICLAVGLQQTTTPNLQITYDEWDDIAREFGFEFVDAEAKGRNEYGEPQGIPRIREALETNDWAMDEPLDLDDDEDPTQSSTSDDNDLGMGSLEFNSEFTALKTALVSNSGEDGRDEETVEDEQVDQLDRMMAHLQAARGMLHRFQQLLTSSDELLNRNEFRNV
ncbi:MAG: hypothetical protein M1820_010919 [Bogoriella megaspora]|nr:MAG: hypothetical protein M1820_010919 [Bogoriella megaspora]